MGYCKKLKLKVVHFQGWLTLSGKVTTSQTCLTGYWCSNHHKSYKTRKSANEGRMGCLGFSRGLILLVNSKQKQQWVCRKGGNKMSGRGQPLKREGINLGNTWDDCSPHSTQPVRNGGGPYVLENKLLATGHWVCLSLRHPILQEHH